MTKHFFCFQTTRPIIFCFLFSGPGAWVGLCKAQIKKKMPVFFLTPGPFTKESCEH